MLKDKSMAMTPLMQCILLINKVSNTHIDPAYNCPTSSHRSISRYSLTQFHSSNDSLEPCMTLAPSAYEVHQICFLSSFLDIDIKTSPRLSYSLQTTHSSHCRQPTTAPPRRGRSIVQRHREHTLFPPAHPPPQATACQMAFGAASPERLLSNLEHHKT